MEGVEECGGRGEVCGGRVRCVGVESAKHLEEW